MGGAGAGGGGAARVAWEEVSMGVLRKCCCMCEYDGIWIWRLFCGSCVDGMLVGGYAAGEGMYVGDGYAGNANGDCGAGNNGDGCGGP